MKKLGKSQSGCRWLKKLTHGVNNTNLEDKEIGGGITQLSIIMKILEQSQGLRRRRN